MMLLEKIIPLIALACSVAGFICYKSWQVAQARKENKKLSEKNQQLEADKAVAQTQVKHHKVRQKNEENLSSTSHNGIVEQLQHTNDLRD